MKIGLVLLWVLQGLDYISTKIALRDPMNYEANPLANLVLGNIYYEMLFKFGLTIVLTILLLLIYKRNHKAYKIMIWCTNILYALAVINNLIKGGVI